LWAWLVATASLAFNIFFVFLPSHLVAARGVSLTRALAAALVGLALMVIAAPGLGHCPTASAASHC
jgi:MFS transporter, MHS family, proline/betaine transporter